MTSAEDFRFLDDRAKRLFLMAVENPQRAIGAAKELVESVCRTVLRLVNEPTPETTADCATVITLTLDALALTKAGIEDAKMGAKLVPQCIQHLYAVVDSFAEVGNAHGLSSRHARLVVGAAMTFANFVASTYLERAG